MQKDLEHTFCIVVPKRWMRRGDTDELLLKIRSMMRDNVTQFGLVWLVMLDTIAILDIGLPCEQTLTVCPF